MNLVSFKIVPLSIFCFAGGLSLKAVAEDSVFFLKTFRQNINLRYFLEILISANTNHG